MNEPLKKHSTIGCCGIDCGLCPRYHTKGDSVCPGCGGKHFKEKHPSCGFVTCCVIKKNLEVCSDCNDYPCNRFEAERSGFDSFVTHKKVFTNLGLIKSNGIELFIDQQKLRMQLLEICLSNFDDGKSKSFYCISCTLLPLDKLKDAINNINRNAKHSSIKDKSRLLKTELETIAKNLQIDLKLNRKR